MPVVWDETKVLSAELGQHLVIAKRHGADWQAMHYLKKTREVRKGDTVKIKMFRNGGYAASLK